jgi:hypothetical protein
MGIFSFTGAALNNLVGNTPGANVSNLVTLLNDLKTFINGGNLDDTNLATGNKSTALLGSYRTVWTSSGAAVITGGAGLYYPNHSGTFTQSAGSLGFQVFVFANDYSTVGRTPMLRLRMFFSPNGTAPGAVSFDARMIPVTLGGGAGGVWGFGGVGAVVTGSTTSTVSSPGANTLNSAASADFALPTDGFYVLALNAGGNTAANNVNLVSMMLQLHFV